MKKKMLLVFLALCSASWAQSVCPTNQWGLVYNLTNGSTGENDWHGGEYIPDLNEFFSWVTNHNSITPESNAFGVITNLLSLNCNLPYDPFVIKELTGGNGNGHGPGYNPPIGYLRVGGTTLVGGVCDGVVPTASSPTICISNFTEGGGNGKFSFTDCTTNDPSVQGSCGAYRIDDEVIEYSVVSISGSYVQLGSETYPLVRGSRQQAGNSPATCHPNPPSCALTGKYPYFFPVSPTAIQDPTYGGMQIDFGSGLLPVTAPGSDMPFTRHPGRTASWDKNAGRIWQMGGWESGPSFLDLWYQCLVSGPNGKCPSSKISQGWIYVTSMPSSANPRFEPNGAYSPVNDAYLEHGSDADFNTYVYCDVVNPSIGCNIGGKFNKISTATCVLQSGSSTPCPTVGGRAGLVFDPDHKVFWLFGGGSASSGGQTTKLWAFSLDGINTLNVPKGKWQLRADVGAAGLGISCTTSPNICSFPAFTYDRLRHILVLYAGPGALLKYVPEADSWSNTGLAVGPNDPPVKYTYSMPVLVHDYDDDVYILTNQNPTSSNPMIWKLYGTAISQY